ncbi:MAG: hypothetical protein JST16_05505 [Bdellovibrionales bacterium]|nr:hypothetical protein [Bdellovibrionales bacterium]
MHALTDAFKIDIENKITEYEKLCSVEFVPVIVRRSGLYQSFRAICALMAMVLVLVVPLAFPLMLPLSPSVLVWAVPAVGLALFSLLGWEPALAWLLPMALKRRHVEEAAEHYFLFEEVFATRQRTGVLIFISVLERSVFVLADKGLTERIPAEKWAELGTRLAADFRRQSAGATFLEALDAIVAQVKDHFPPEAAHPNELSNVVRDFS